MCLARARRCGMNGTVGSTSEVSHQMRPLFPALVLLFAAACGAPAPSEDGTGAQASSVAAASADHGVALRLATSTVECAGGDCTAGTIQHTHYSLLVQNLAYEKVVTVHLTGADGSTSDVA